MQAQVQMQMAEMRESLVLLRDEVQRMQPTLVRNTQAVSMLYTTPNEVGLMVDAVNDRVLLRALEIVRRSHGGRLMMFSTKTTVQPPKGFIAMVMPLETFSFDNPGWIGITSRIDPLSQDEVCVSAIMAEETMVSHELEPGFVGFELVLLPEVKVAMHRV